MPYGAIQSISVLDAINAIESTDEDQHLRQYCDRLKNIDPVCMPCNQALLQMHNPQTVYTSWLSSLDWTHFRRREIQETQVWGHSPLAQVVSNTSNTWAKSRFLMLPAAYVHDRNSLTLLMPLKALCKMFIEHGGSWGWTQKGEWPAKLVSRTNGICIVDEPLVTRAWPGLLSLLRST